MKDQLFEIVEPLLKWYSERARVLPWREDPTPYRVWISEVMLQQTRVETVKPYFERFVAELPDLKALAQAPEELLLKLWEGLGYYSRVRNLQKAARIVLERFGGALPAEASELISLPGIGEYTAGAVASIAFGNPEPAVDGNVLRVVARLTANRTNVREPAAKRNVADMLAKIYPKNRAGDFTQSLMELGAVVCLPNGAPLCERCPLRTFCKGYLTGTASELPVKTKKPKRKIERKTVFLLRCGRKTALVKRPETGLLAGLWEFPNVVGALSQKRAEAIVKKWGIHILGMNSLPKANHLFSHVEWHMTGYYVESASEAEGFVWAFGREIAERYTVPSAFKAFFPLLRPPDST